MAVFDALYFTYGPQHWWPGDSPFEVIIGAILTQNTAWQNVSQAIENLRREGLLDARALVEADPDEVKLLIAPAGFYNVKYDRLRNILEYLMSQDMDLDRFRRLPVTQLRDELLNVKGVGPETADSILLYAFDRLAFVVDAYTRRLFSRLGYGWMARASYDEVQGFFMEQLPRDTSLYNEFHALVVVHCKETCRSTPLCSECCLRPPCAGGP
ncbi:MAG: endonuclease [Anaerolineae bacterium]|nr:endonuclease [Anaerolineae bacterium]NIN93862.1 endonuclease [Anaerolineae bacterium]NIQ76895.1 endonuclease [Anaerolineae bacterium]